MATAGDGSALYESAGAGGKFQRRPIRRSTPVKPYDRPHTALKNNNPSMLKKLVDPASRLLYAGAHRLFDVFRNSLPPLSVQRPLGSSKEPLNVPQEERRSDSSANIAAATGISELEQMLQEKSFTRSEIQRLTSLLHSRTTESPSGDSLEKHQHVRDHFHAAISTPIVTSKVFEEIASPAEVAKSYMGSRKPTNQACIQGSKLIQRPPITALAQKTANSLWDLETGFVTPRSRARSAMYTMARTPYTRSPTFSQKGIRSGYGHGSASTSSQSSLGHEGEMAIKHRSSVFHDGIGSCGPLRRIRQKSIVLEPRDKKELGYTVFQQGGLSQNLPLPNETKPKVSGYASVPAKSTQTANKILQHLEKPSPQQKNEKNSVSSHHARLHEPTSQSKNKTEENGSRKFLVPNNMLTSVNGDSTTSLKDKEPIVGLADLLSKVQEEPPQKKRAFQMSAPVSSVEIDNGIHDNGHVSFSVVKNTKPETSVTDTHKLVENISPLSPEVAKVSGKAEVKETENATSVPNTDVGFLGGSVREQGLGFKIPISSPSTTTTHSSVLPQSTLQIEKIGPEKDSSSSLFVKTTENVLPVPFSANKLSELETNSSDLKTIHSTSVNGNGNGNDQKSTNRSGSFLFGTVTKNVNVPASNTTTFPSLAPFPAPASTSAVISTATTASTTISTPTTTAAAIFSTSVSPPVFNFRSASSTAPTTSMTETANISNQSPFATATTTTTGSGIFAFSSPAATLTTTITSQSQGSFFNITNGSQTNTQASSSSTHFGPSAPAFGSSPSLGIGSFGPSSETNSGNSTSGSTTSLFGSTWRLPQSSPTPSFATGGATNSSFVGPPVFAIAAASPNNNNNNNNSSSNDQMSMEDSMAEDSMQTNSPVSQFVQPPVGAPGFMFGSATPSPTPAVVPFQFGGQSNQTPPPHNPFQSSSLEFNGGGGSFLLGSGGEKSNRRIVRVVKSKNRRKRESE